MDPASLVLWEGLIGQAVSLGVKSFSTVHAMLVDAGVPADDAAIEILRGKWDVLYADVARAAGPQ
jgi:hypothetical protein